jgi:hypothetical protein
MKGNEAFGADLRPKSGAHYISILETGCQELEALVKLIAVHHNASISIVEPKSKALARASEEAISQLACIKACSLLFDERRDVASLQNFLAKNPIESSSDDLLKSINETISITPDPTKENHFIAIPLSIDEVAADTGLKEMNIEGTKEILSRHKRICSVFERLKSRSKKVNLKEARDLWLAHASLASKEMRFVQHSNQTIYHFLKQCSMVLRVSVETYKPAVFERNGRHTWHAVNSLIPTFSSCQKEPKAEESATGG